MASKSNFDMYEWQLLMSSPHLIYSMLTSGADNIIGAEARALSKILTNYQTENPLILDVMTTKGKTYAGVETKDTQIAYSIALDKMKQIGDLLAEKFTYQEAEEFRVFLLTIARKIAQAAGEEFLGFGRKVSDREAKAMGDMAIALQATEEDKFRRQKEQKERIYEVKPGDSLSKIAEKFYGNTSEWSKIYEANKDQIQDPNLIHPGQKFHIP